MAFADAETGECGERRLNHSDGEAEKFYRELAARGASVRVGMEATRYSRWFERLLAELGVEVWIGNAAEIRTKRVRKQKTDRNDAQLLLKLLLEDTFPRIWVPSPENRDLRQLLWHRHRMVQMRTRIMNQLQALAMDEGQRRKKKLWDQQGRAQLEKLPLATWASRRSSPLHAIPRLDLPSSLETPPLALTYWHLPLAGREAVRINDLERNRADSTPQNPSPTTDSFSNEPRFFPDGRSLGACTVFRPIRREAVEAELLFWEWPADDRVGNQHVKFFLALYASNGLLVHRTSPRSYIDMNNLFLFAMLAVNRNFGLFHA
ncbi:MAG: transposase [Candidatus Acidiferrales bacterium]